MQNTPTSGGNDLPARETPFREKKFELFLGCLSSGGCLMVKGVTRFLDLVSPQKFFVFLHVFGWEMTKYEQKCIFSNLACPKNPETHIFQEKKAPAACTTDRK